MADEARWVRLMGALELAPHLKVCAALRAAWAESHRRYHDTTHLDACLATLDEFASEAGDAAEVEAALWFHDAIYTGRRKDDEARSGEWARAFLSEAGATPERAARVEAHVLATRHAVEVADPDARLVVDIDLAILGRSEAVYDLYERNVREEYRWVPGPLFRRERRKVLRSFLERRAIYATPALHARFEARARVNLERAIAALS